MEFVQGKLLKIKSIGGLGEFAYIEKLLPKTVRFYQIIGARGHFPQGIIFKRLWPIKDTMYLLKNAKLATNKDKKKIFDYIFDVIINKIV
jgi:hypothetical protein